MSTLGNTSKPSTTQEWSGANTNNQVAMDLTFPAGGPWKVTKIGMWVNGKDMASTFRGVLWSSTRNSILGTTASFNANNEPFGVGNSDLFEKSFTTPPVVAGGTKVYAGWHCDPDEPRQWGRRSGDHYDDSETSESPQPMSGEALDSGGAIGVYLVYELDDQAPSAPTLTSPANGARIITATPQLQFTHSDPDGDPLATYDLQVTTDPTWASATHWNIAAQTLGIVGNTVDRTYAGTALARGTTYYWRARTTANGLTGPWSAARSFTYNALPTIGSRVPAASALAYIHNLSDLALWSGSEAKPQVKFTPSDADADTITKYRLRIYDAAVNGNMVYDSGEVAVSWTQGVQQTINVNFGIANGTERWWTIDVYDGYEWAGEAARTAFKMRWAQGLYEFDTGSTNSTNWQMLTGAVVEQVSLLFRGADTSGGDTATGKTAFYAAIGSVPSGKRWVQVLVRMFTDTAGTSATLADMTFNYYGTPNTPDGWTVS